MLKPPPLGARNIDWSKGITSRGFFDPAIKSNFITTGKFNQDSEIPSPGRPGPSGMQTAFGRNNSKGFSGTMTPNKSGWQTPRKADLRVRDFEGMIDRDEQGSGKVSAGRKFFRTL